MRAMIDLLMGMPKMLLLKLVLLMGRRPRTHGEHLTCNDLMMRAKAIRELLLSLPVPNNEIEAGTVLSILMWGDNELSKIDALQKANFIVAGTVPVFHTDSVPAEKRN